MYGTVTTFCCVNERNTNSTEDIHKELKELFEDRLSHHVIRGKIS